MVTIISFGPNGTWVEYDREFPGGVLYAAEHCRQQINNFSYYGEGFFICDSRGEYFAIVDRDLFFLYRFLPGGKFNRYNGPK